MWTKLNFFIKTKLYLALCIKGKKRRSAEKLIYKAHLSEDHSKKMCYQKSTQRCGKQIM